MTVSQRDTVEAFLIRSGRDHLPLRRSFVQRRQRGGGPGPLAAFVRQRRGRALDLYLLVHAVASAEPFDAVFPAAVWARALGLGDTSSAETLVSNSWTWLEARRLITTARRRRRRAITLLAEDGSGDPYSHPGAAGRGDYFKLPYSYWEGNFHNRLSLPAKAVLLIALSLQDDFSLPTERGAAWYGVSRDTVRKGLRVLQLLGLLEARVFPKPAPLERHGYTLERRYTLREPFRPLPARDRPDGADDQEPTDSDESVPQSVTHAATA